MRVLICDQESEMLERIAREFEVDVATNKVTCIDLMRANPFDVVVASERLVDGSGLELLSSIATRWPDTLRVLAIEPERRRMLGGKLAPFRLHATIRYPIDEDELERRLAELDSLLAQEDYEEEEDSSSNHDPPPAQPQRPAAPAAARSNAVPVPGHSNASPAPARSNASSAPGRSNASSAPARSNTSPAPAPTRGNSPAMPARTNAPAIPTRANAPAVPAHASASAIPARPNAQAVPARPANSAPAARAPSGGASLGRQAPAAAPPKGTTPLRNQSVTVISSSTTASRQPAGVAPPPVRRKLGNYTPLGAPEDADLRIVAREFDESVAPIAARAIRAREEANRERTPTEKARSVADHVSRTLRRLLKR